MKRQPLNRISHVLGVFILLLSSMQLQSQPLKAGFDELEYKDMILIFACTSGDSSRYTDYAAPQDLGYEKLYRSKPMGMDNLWELWLHEERKVAVVSIRGSTEKHESWILNLYSSMIPAKGEMKWKGGQPFQYDLADDPEAAIHVGWTLGMGFIYQDMRPHLDKLYEKGIRNVILTGHSQGGVITILLTSHLLRLQQQGKLPQDIQFKTYASAAPKPGNEKFAEAYEDLVVDGWEYNVVNAADWVPEVPMSVETYDDFDHSNPLSHAKSLILGQQGLRRTLMEKVYEWVKEPTQDLLDFYDRSLGEITDHTMHTKIPGLEVPPFDTSIHYISAGRTIKYYPDEAYFQKYEREPKKTFKHHDRLAYMYLLEKHGEYLNTFDVPKAKWQLDRIDGKDYRLYYADGAPTLHLVDDGTRLYGKAGFIRYQCNISGNESRVVFDSPMVVTEYLGHGTREKIFLENLQKCDNYIIRGNKLSFRRGRDELLRFYSK